ncbi:hypothetical protein F5884DRAFT_838288 [Xylogone sp. PMI_703]|nr:hypothetical protein F5884DRAFT_838288 [Xylogone sp. PMI_703]
MPDFVKVLENDWSTEGPRTPAQQFIIAYFKAIDKQDWSQSAFRFYSPSLTFYDRGAGTYKGGEQAWKGASKVLGPVQTRHDALSVIEIPRPDGTILLSYRGLRHVWVEGHSSNQDTPTVTIPMYLATILGPSESPEGFNNLQQKETWLYWEANLLTPFLKTEEAMFKNEAAP